MFAHRAHLTLAGAVITAEAANALPAGPPLAERTRPAAAADAPLLEHAPHPAVGAEPGAADYGAQEPPDSASYHPRDDLPGSRGVAKSLENVRWHRVEPAEAVLLRGDGILRARRRWERVRGAAGLAVAALERKVVPATSSPALTANQVHVPHGSGAHAGRYEGVVPVPLGALPVHGRVRRGQGGEGRQVLVVEGGRRLCVSRLFVLRSEPRSEATS